MAGVNSLGIGSGVLTADLLDKLREADNAAILTPLETKLELSTQKDEAYKLLDGFMTTFKQSTATLGGESMYQGREVNGNDDFVSISAQAGSDLQSFNITDVIKAEKDVWNSTSTFASTTTAIPSIGTGTLVVTVGENSLEIPYTATTTLDDIKTAINDSTAINATATNLKIGDDAYSFSVSSDNLNEAITFSAGKQKDFITLAGDAVSGDTYEWSDGTNTLPVVSLVAGETIAESGARIADAINADPTLKTLYTATATSTGFTIESKTNGLAFTGASTSTGTQTSIDATDPLSTDISLIQQLGLDDTVNANIQVAREASFKMNGIAITRSTNSIDDLVNGVTISLNKNHGATDSSSLSVSQNSTTITTEMDLFVTNFNSLTSNLKDMTIYNQETGTAGIFNSESFIKSITNEITNILNRTDSSGNSLYDYGIEISRDGVMSMDSSTFSTKLSSDPSALELLFRGQSDTITPYKQTNTVTLTGNAATSDTFTWDDGDNGVLVDLVAGETPAESGARIAAAINADSILSTLYYAQETSTGFSIRSLTEGLEFTGSSTSVGTQTSREVTTTAASKTASDAVIGIFQELDSKMLSYTGNNQLLSNFNTQLSDTKKNLISEYDKQKASLDVRYETLTTKFSAYDAIINKLNNQFASLQLLIDAESSDS